MNKLFATILLVILSFTLAGCGSEPTSDEEIVEIYKQLSLKGIESQKVVEDEEVSVKILQKTYVEPALSEYMESQALMRANNIKRIYNNPKFTNITVIQNDGNLALIKVEAEHSGDEFSIKSPVKNFGPFAFDYLAEVTLRNVKGKWYISEVKPDSPK